MTRLLLVRHGETAWNAAGRFQGHADIPLNRRGQRQAAALAQVLAKEDIHALYASDLQRTWETAQTLAAPLGLEVQEEARMREMAFGRWEGLTFDEIQQQDADVLAACRADPSQVAPPGGETLDQVTHRVQAAFDHIRSTHPEHTVVAVAHGGSLRILLCLALGLPPQSYRRFALEHTSLSELHLSEQGTVLTKLNLTHHLAGIT